MCKDGGVLMTTKRGVESRDVVIEVRSMFGFVSEHAEGSPRRGHCRERERGRVDLRTSSVLEERNER